MKKKVLSFLMLLCVLISYTSNANAATNASKYEELEINLSAISEVFPEAHVEKEYWDLSKCEVSIIDQKIVTNSEKVNSKLEEINNWTIVKPVDTIS